MTNILNNRYKILKSLGQGAFGIVHLAEDIKSNGEK